MQQLVAVSKLSRSPLPPYLHILPLGFTPQVWGFFWGRGNKNDSSPNYSQITSTAVQNEQKTTVPVAAAAANQPAEVWRLLLASRRYQSHQLDSVREKKRLSFRGNGLTQARVRPLVSISLDLLCLHIRLALKVAIGQANRI